MKSLKKFALILLLPLLAFTAAHKFYVSVTNVVYSEKDTSLQITSRMFIDDMEQVIEERYELNTQLASENEHENTDALIEKYIRAKFVVKTNGTVADFNFIGKKYDDDMIVCYLEIPEVSLDDLKSIEVQNEVLHDLFEEQQNIVHLKFNQKKRSFVLIRENNKGMLNF